MNKLTFYIIFIYTIALAPGLVAQSSALAPKDILETKVICSAIDRSKILFEQTGEIDVFADILEIPSQNSGLGFLVTRLNYHRSEQSDVIMGNWTYAIDYRLSAMTIDNQPWSFQGQLNISKDSVKIRFGDFERVKNYSWSTRVTNKLIFLIEKEYAVLKILSLDNNEMTLEIGLEPNENKKRLVYRRE